MPVREELLPFKSAESQASMAFMDLDYISAPQPSTSDIADKILQKKVTLLFKASDTTALGTLALSI